MYSHFHSFLACIALCISCNPDALCGNGEEKSFLINSIKPSAFIEGRINGFDLDGLVSEQPLPENCFLYDAVDHEGNTGIDNALSTMLVDLEGTELEMFPQYIEYSIQQGTFLTMIHITGIDDPVSDDCVEVELVLVEGDVLIGGDENILDGQTLYRKTAEQRTSSQAFISDGILHAEGLRTSLLIDGEDFLLDIPIHNIALRGAFKDGKLQGHLGGVSDINDLLVLSQIAYAGFFSFLQDRMYQHADMNPDANGVCQGISSGFDFDSINAHLR